MLIIIFITVFYFYIKYKNYSYDKKLQNLTHYIKKEQSKINKTLESKKNESNEPNYNSLQKYITEQNTNNDLLNEPSKNIDGIRVNIQTRGPTPQVAQIGILSKLDHTNNSGPGSDSESHILPLMGRKTYNRSNKFVYYTATDKYNQVKIPISHNGRDCGGEYGCDEIMDGDIINIPELNGSFKAKIYENTKLHYIPY